MNIKAKNAVMGLKLIRYIPDDSENQRSMDSQVTIDEPTANHAHASFFIKPNSAVKTINRPQMTWNMPIKVQARCWKRRASSEKVRKPLNTGSSSHRKTPNACVVLQKARNRPIKIKTIPLTVKNRQPALNIKYLPKLTVKRRQAEIE